MFPDEQMHLVVLALGAQKGASHDGISTMMMETSSYNRVRGQCNKYV